VKNHPFGGKEEFCTEINTVDISDITLSHKNVYALDRSSIGLGSKPISAETAAAISDITLSHKNVYALDRSSIGLKSKPISAETAAAMWKTTHFMEMSRTVILEWSTRRVEESSVVSSESAGRMM